MPSHTTAIEWTHVPGYAGATWNPVVGCSIVSPGCSNCYAMRFAGNRLDGNASAPHYAGTTKPSKAGPVWTGKVALAAHKLTEPLRAKKPRAYFVNSMGDLFHEDVPDAWIDQVFAVMALTPQHLYIILTKRSARMLAFLSRGDDEHGDYFERLSDAAVAISGSPCAAHVESTNWPLPNVWLGVSAERQQEADERIPDLLATPAVVRFVSAEPLLGPVDFVAPTYQDVVGYTHQGYLRHRSESDDYRFHTSKLDWMIVGGESGPGARPMHPDWARAIRDQCAAASVPFFFKQWGEWIDVGPAWGTAAGDAHDYRDTSFIDADGTVHRALENAARCARAIDRVGKRGAGRTLDGREHTEWPIMTKSAEVAA